MNKYRLSHGKHPAVIENKVLVSSIESISLRIDPFSRIIPGRFHPRRGKRRENELIVSIYNPKELRLKINGKKFTQRFKIECSTNEIANKIRIEVQKFLKIMGV